MSYLGLALLGIDSSLLAHSSQNDNIYISSQSGCHNAYWEVTLLTGDLLLNLEQLVNLLANLSIGDLDIVLGVAIIVHEGEETIVGDIDLYNTMSDLHAT